MLTTYGRSSSFCVDPLEKKVYVMDAADTAANRKSIIRFVQNADVLFIEAVFAEADVPLATERANLTTATAGRIARGAGGAPG